MYLKPATPFVGAASRFGDAPLRWYERGMLLTRHLANDARQWYMLYVPRETKPDTQVFVSVHGVSRDAIEHATWFVQHAERAGAVLVVPVFCAARYRDYQSLAGGRSLARADEALQGILSEVRRLAGLRTMPIRLFGYSAGAQFAHRYALLHPGAVRRLALGAAGRYTFPCEATRYPRGVAGMAERLGACADLDAFCAMPIRVWVGEFDVVSDAKLSRNPKVVSQQGEHRLERAHRWVEAVMAEARARRVPADIACRIVPGADHNFAACAANGMAEQVAGFLLGLP